MLKFFLLLQYRWDKAFHFTGKFHFLVKTITDSDRLGLVYLNLVFSTANGVMFCEIYLQSAANITALIRYWFIHLIFKFFLTDPRSLIPRSSILDPDFPVNLEFLLIKIILFFSTTEVISCSKTINTFKRKNSLANPFRKSSIWDFYSMDMTCCK